uniref:asparagine synthase (glutamine-hydrolyzing) n=1 Tax=Actinomadura melliaura TaxID=360723 RepID=Q0H2X8_9ACTN|nr:putative amidotransferase [Actinomadura melliaura]
MCGITGWIDFARDLSADSRTLLAMAGSLGSRGPDDRGTWLSRHAALAHTRLAVIDPPGGTQPMTAEQDGRPLAVVVFSGEIYNFRELRRELESRGHAFRTRSDTEVVLRGHLEWGAGLPDRLNGMFAYAVWDVRTETLTLVRDRLGVKPLYYFPTDDGVLFGSEPKAILRHPAVRPELDADGLRELLTMVNTPGHGVFRGMAQVRPGSTVTFSRNGVQHSTYWSLAARPHTDDFDRTVSTVRELLEDIVARQLVADVPLGVILSGGLDSSTLAALAMRQADAPVRTFSVDFRQPDGSGTADAPFVAEAAEHLGLDHRELVLDSAALAERSLRTGVVHARDFPLGLGDMDNSLYLLFRAVRQHVTVGLSGEGSDELFGGYAWFQQEEALRGETFPWMAAQGQAGGPSFLDPDLAEILDLQSYTTVRFKEALADTPRLPGEDQHEARLRQAAALFLTHFLPMLLDRKDRLSMAHGLEIRVPFCDHRLVEYVFNVPWRMKTQGGREKGLLRAAVADLLPLSILERRKTPYPVIADPAYEAALRAELESLFADSDAPVFGLLDREAARGVLSWRLPPEHRGVVRTVLETVLRINDWLRDYQVRLVL